MAEKFKVLTDSLGDMADGITNMCTSVFHQQESVVRLLTILENQDVAYTTGVGKSGHVARYFADLLSSVGFPAHYIDPFSAMHGDLGRIEYAAPLIVFSNSGATEDLVPLLKAISYRNHIIFITGQEHFPLEERFSELSINTGPHVEGNTLGFPGGSVVAQIMFCAALVAELVERNNVTESDYRTFHPGGTIGKRLSELRDEDV